MPPCRIASHLRADEEPQPVTLLDLLIVGFVVPLGLVGYRRGAAVSAITVAAFALGAFIGARVASGLTDEAAAGTTYAALLAMIGGLVVGHAAGVVAEEAASARYIRPVYGRAGTLADGLGGAALLGSLALAQAWVLGAVLLTVPHSGLVGDVTPGSAILSNLYRVASPSGALFEVLVSVEPRSQHGPDARVGPPDPAIAGDASVLRARRSVVRVRGTACGLRTEGSGWVVRPGLVVTTAHGVAGQTDTTVEAPDGTELAALAFRYDPLNDFAILRVEGLEAPALEMVGRPSRGTVAAALGFPADEPFTIEPARLGSTQSVVGEDAYGHSPVVREMTPFKGEVRPGYSGGPVVDPAGRVLTTVFGIREGDGASVGLGVPNEEVRRALGSISAPVGTGRCADLSG